MAFYGPPPKPTIQRIREGNLGRKPIPKFEPQYQCLAPERPASLSPDAKKYWDKLVSQMARSGVLRPIDQAALADLCEDQAMVDKLRRGIRETMAQIDKMAKEQGKKPIGGALVQMSRTVEGRRTLSTLGELMARVMNQRREFGLTPASNTRLETVMGHEGGPLDAIEAALCG